MNTCLHEEDFPYVRDPESILGYTWGYALDPLKIKTYEDALKVLDHLANRVDLTIQDIEGIEDYIKPSTLALRR